MRPWLLIVALFFVGPSVTRARFEVCLVNSRTIGQRALLKLELRHSFLQPVRSARAQVFLSRADGVVVGRVVRWIIGSESGLEALPPDMRTNYYFAVPIEGVYETVHFSFSRVVLEDGSSADTEVDWSVRAKE